MSERDLLHTEVDESNKLYVMTPTPMMEWMREFVQDSLKYPEMVVLVPSKSLNPEEVYYYQDFEFYPDVAVAEKADTTDTRPLVVGGAKP